MFQSFKQHCIDFYLTTCFIKIYHMIFYWCSTSKHVILFYVICLFVSSFYLMILYLFYHISNYCIFCYTPQIILLGIGIVRFHSFQISWIDMLASQLSFSGAPRLNLPPLPGGQSLARLGALKNQIENQSLGQSNVFCLRQMASPTSSPSRSSTHVASPQSLMGSPTFTEAVAMPQKQINSESSASVDVACKMFGALWVLQAPQPSALEAWNQGVFVQPPPSKVTPCYTFRHSGFRRGIVVTSFFSG